MTYNVFGEMLSLTLLLARGQPDGLEFATDNLRDPTVAGVALHMLKTFLSTMY